MKNVVVTGYNGSGATAMRHFLMEYINCDTIERRSYEHILFYTPNGLFDLENKLLLRNNQSRSDEALISFKKEMYKLWKNDFNWCGGYKAMYGNQFKDIYEKFLEKLTQFKIEGTWSYDLKEKKYSIKKILKDTIKTSMFKKVNEFGLIANSPEDQIINCSLVTKEEYFNLAREFVNEYLNMINKNNSEYFIYDHLLKPYDIDEINKYFDENFRMIIVERDVRDIYLYGKYIRPSQNNGQSKYPKNPKEFIEFWKKIKKIEKNIYNNKVLKIYIEELIYNYEKTVMKVENFLELDAKMHINKNKFFDIQKAKENSRIFEKNKLWKKEIQKIEEELNEYIFFKG